MPRSQPVLPSFTLALSGSVTLRDFQPARNREIHIPVMRTVDLRTAPAQDFIVYKSEYYPDPDAASLFGDAQDGQLISKGFFWRYLKVVLLKIKGFGGKLFTL